MKKIIIIYKIFLILFVYYNILKITPTLKISQTISYGYYLSLRLAISGATNPGVPHLGKI